MSLSPSIRQFLSGLLLTCFPNTEILASSGNLTKVSPAEPSQGTQVPGTLANQIPKAGNCPRKPCVAECTGDR